ncbi:MAG: hypothetical protein Q8L37_07165 [Candidatus Gottesmanbacteria bacterium]|nr:hypothetical protein [Candidatus Gottesmanbacteria bacterium]
MKLQLYALPDEKLSAMATRLRERIAEKPAFLDKTNLQQIDKELLHRQRVRSASLQELSEIAPDDPHKSIKKHEVELRTRLQLLDRNSREYESIYHQWFTVREEGLLLKLWPFFTPAAKRRTHGHL